MEWGAVAAADQLGEPTVRLVHDECVLRILLGLRDGPMAVSRLAGGIPGTTRRTVLRRLQELSGEGLVVACDEAGEPIAAGRRAAKDACYVLTPLGPVALDVPAEAIWWETHLPGSTRATAPDPHAFPGMRALGMVSDPANRLIVRELGDGPLPTADLFARIPAAKRATVFRRLGHLTEERLILHAEIAGEMSYVLTDEIRRLARVLLRAARCEWLRANEADRARTSDLPGLLHVVAALARIPAGVSGIYLLEIESETTLQPRIYLAAASGRITAMPIAPSVSPGAIGRGSPAACCEALLRGDPSHITREGDEALARGILEGFGRVLRRPKAP